MADQFTHVFESEKMDYLIDYIIEDIMENFSLKKQPDNITLAACLDAYTKAKLIKLAEINNFDVKKSWNKDRIIETIGKEILSTIDNRFLILDEQRQLQLLQKVAKNKLNHNQFTVDTVDFYLSVYSKAVQMGLVYSRDEGEFISSFIPQEIAEKLDEFLNHYEEKIENYRADRQRWEKIENILLAGVNLYGTLTKDKIMDLWELQYLESDWLIEEMKEYMDVENKYLPLLIIRNGLFFVEGIVIGSDHLLNEENVIDFYQYQSGKMNDNYYLPTKKELQYYSKHEFNQKSPTYQKLKKMVERSTEQVKLVMTMIEKYILMEQELSDLLESFEEMNVILFENEKQVMKFVALYTELHNKSRLWLNAGYTPEELDEEIIIEVNGVNPAEENQTKKNVYPLFGSENNQLPQQPKQVKKVGRNEPCPCGSGKKYKKCCWRKER